MNGKAKFLDEKVNLVGSRKQTKGNLFYLNLSESSSFVAQVEKNWLWHKKLCHVNFDNLVKIIKNRRVRGIHSLRKYNIGLYKNCKIGKMGKKDKFQKQRLSFRRSLGASTYRIIWTY